MEPVGEVGTGQCNVGTLRQNVWSGQGNLTEKKAKGSAF